MTEQEKFMARLEDARKGGLVDMKFFFRPSRAMKSEDIFAAMNEVDDAVRRGRQHTSWKGNVPA